MATATHHGHQTNGHVTIDDPKNPLQRLTPEQIEAIGREFDELHEQVKDSLGERDARYIRSVIALQRRLALLGRLELIASRWRIPWAVGAGTLGLAKILENMEIGHNVLHGQWDWMNDPGDQFAGVGLGHRLDRRGVAPFAQLHPPHVHEHPRQGPRPRLRDHADRPGAEVAPGLPAPALLQRPARDAVRVGRRRPRPQLRGDPQGREGQEAASQGAEGDRRQGPDPDPEGLHRLASDQRDRDDAGRGRVLQREGGGRAPARARRGDQERAEEGPPLARAVEHQRRQAPRRTALVPRAVPPHADRRHRRQPDPQRVVVRDHLLRSFP